MLDYLITGLLLCSGLVLFFSIFRNTLVSSAQKRVFFGSACLFISVGTLRLQALGFKKSETDTRSQALLESKKTYRPELFDKMTFLEWQKYDSDKQLEIGIRLLKELRQEQLFLVSIRSEQDFTSWALALNNCLADIPSSSNALLRDLVVLCVKQDLQKYK